MYHLHRGAGLFFGPVHVEGSFSVNGPKNFKIDHPLDPANKFLYHSSIESPDMLNLYNGIATLDEAGEAVIEMPNWFEALNFDFRYQHTALDSASPNLHIAEEIKSGISKLQVA